MAVPEDCLRVTPVKRAVPMSPFLQTTRVSWAGVWIGSWWRRALPPGWRPDDRSAARPLAKRAAAEFLGTSWLVFGGCGSALLAATAPSIGIGWLGVSLAFGLTLLTTAYVIGPISGCHLNPAVSVGLAASGRFPIHRGPSSGRSPVRRSCI